MVVIAGPGVCAFKMLSTRVTVIALLAATLCLTSGGTLYDVACPGVNSELQCPAGQVIKVIFISGGVKSDANCADRKKPVWKSLGRFVHNGMTQWVPLICDNLQRCRLPKPDKKMFMTKNSQDNFLQIAYVCQRRRARVQKVVACEKQTAELKCERGLIKVESAKYGRFDENTCTTKPSDVTYCGSFHVKKRVQMRCNGLKKCSIKASYDYMGPTTPSFKIPMYLLLDYTCD